MESSSVVVGVLSVLLLVVIVQIYRAGNIAGGYILEGTGELKDSHVTIRDVYNPKTNITSLSLYVGRKANDAVPVGELHLDNTRYVYEDRTSKPPIGYISTNIITGRRSLNVFADGDSKEDSYVMHKDESTLYV
jgi:hypothetical protein